MATTIADADLVAERLKADIANGDHVPVRLSNSLELEGALFDEVRLLHRSLDAGFELGLGLEPDRKVITGALARFEVATGEQWRASFDSVGDVAIRARRGRYEELL
jgi:hypothetical protein